MVEARYDGPCTSWTKDSQEEAQLKHLDRSATDVPRQSCIQPVATMHFLVAGSKGTVCTAGHLLEVDGSSSKIDEGVAALFRGVT